MHVEKKPVGVIELSWKQNNVAAVSTGAQLGNLGLPSIYRKWRDSVSGMLDESYWDSVCPAIRPAI